jgi:predicted AlkP superfamily phosphohydrolase/phosphomutase
MSKVMILGIDGLDSLLLSKFEKDLPNFRKLKENSPDVKMKSVFPPDSPTAWTSIYTGKNPAEHGVILFKDPFTPTKVCEYLGTDISGKTFWDVAGSVGRKVCVVFPHLGYPVWPVNGVMVGRTTEVDVREFDIQTYPAALSEKYDMSGLKPMTSYPLNIGDVIKPTKELILNETKLGVKLLEDIDWDLYFIYFSSIDNIEHLFWMYYDENDPEHQKDNPYKNVIPEFYKFYDEHVIGKFLQYLDSDTTLIVLSDHGHAMRPAKVVNVNEMLRKNGFLQSKISDEKKMMDRHYLLELSKKNVASIINKYRLVGKMASKFLSLFPKSLSAYTNMTPIDRENTIAYLSDPSGGLKAYSYAGIRIKKDKGGEEYKKICTEIIDLLSGIKDPNTSEDLLEWACMREEVYNGGQLFKYPDILFKLKDDWGVGWEINEELFGKSLSHRIHSGNHRQETAVFLMCGNNNVNNNKNMTLMDIAPTVLDLLGVRKSFRLDWSE